MSMEDYNFAKAREAWSSPVKIVQYNCLCGRTMKFESEHGVIAPQRTWVGLTADEQSFVYDQVKQIVDSKPFWVRFANAIEAKLEEKNNA